MTSDLEQTRLLRQARVDEKRTVKDLNQIGKRMAWVRETLEMSQREVCIETKIPFSTYNGREAGLRAELLEEYFILSKFFNGKWQERFNDPYPMYAGEEVKKVSPEWLMFGHSDLEANAERIIQEYQIMLTDLENDYLNKEWELLRQLDMFKLA